VTKKKKEGPGERGDRWRKRRAPKRGAPKKKEKRKIKGTEKETRGRQKNVLYS